MAFHEAERGSSLQKFPGDERGASRKCVNLEGFARLFLPGGRSMPVTANLRMVRSFFSTSGDGRLWMSEGARFDATCMHMPLQLVFSGAATVLIEVKEARWAADGCRCSFVVYA